MKNEKWIHGQVSSFNLYKNIQHKLNQRYEK